MKRNKLYWIIYVFILGLSAHALNAQTTHEITLAVDTKNPNPGKTCSFKVGKNTEVLNNSSAGNFTILAQVGDNIKWKGASSTEPETPVKIIEIKYISGPRIFTSDIIKGDKSVQATVIRGGNVPYKYEILYGVGSSTASYSIISKIQIGE